MYQYEEIAVTKSIGSIRSVPTLPKPIVPSQQKIPFLTTKSSPKSNNVHTFHRGVFDINLTQDNFSVLLGILREYLSSMNIDYSVYDGKIYGYLFKQISSVCFRIELLYFNGNPILRFTRLEGNAFILNDFFKELESSLARQDYCQKEEENHSEFTLFGDDSVDLGLKYLCLSFDPEIIESWCDILESGSFDEIVNILSLLSHNLEDEENLTEILKFKNRLVNAIFKIIQQTHFQKNLPTIHWISSILTKIGSLTLSPSEVNGLVKLFTIWTKSKEEKRQIDESNPVRCSNEIESKLAGVLAGLDQNLLNKIRKNHSISSY